MKNPLIDRVAASLGIKKKEPVVRMADAAGLLVPPNHPVLKTLLPALASSKLSVPVRCAIMAAPPLSIQGVPERLAHAAKIEGMCFAAAKSSGHDLLNRLAVGYVMAGATPDHVRRDLTDFLVDIEGAAISTAHPQSAGAGVQWASTVERFKAAQAAKPEGEAKA
ncbi:hypothetical protein [Dyella jiangningensis]|uniref:Uncharacterized protein n=1 Tax=Dyella jiangningensis TaxID=1379159 RepID=A0A328P0S3_9GAMM|nr:hypothetical protein [Dyella jiangningensis]RAO75788.1 hypothetical protein CA260_17270 [Dyella jiangningensis]